VLAAHCELLANRVLAVIADSPSLARTELFDARQVAADLGAELVEVGSPSSTFPATARMRATAAISANTPC
jgi:uncharacterized protein